MFTNLVLTQAHYEKNGLVIMYNNVSALQNQRTLTCDTIKYFSSENRLLSIGDSHIWDSDYDLKADSLTVFTDIDSGVAIGSVILKQKGQTINAKRIEYKKNKEHDGISYTAIGNVIIKDSSRIATCGKANYNRKNEITRLTINPKINDNNRILIGEQIFLSYNQEKLKKLYIPDKAFAITSAILPWCMALSLSTNTSPVSLSRINKWPVILTEPSSFASGFLSFVCSVIIYLYYYIKYLLSILK